MKLNLACGNNKLEGYVNIDIIKTDASDEVLNLEEYPYPYEDSSVEEIFCSHFVEHVKDLIPFMDELHRILQPEGKITIIAPYFTSIRAYGDPTHRRYINEWTFLYFNKAWRETNKLQHYNIKSDFDFMYGYILAPEWQNRSDEARTFAIQHYWNVVNDIQFTLTKRKQ